MRSSIACLLTIAAAFAVVLPTSSAEAAKPRKPHGKTAHTSSSPRALHFLGREPHGPLTAVKDKKVLEPNESACRTWADDGSVWVSLDRLGRPVGKAAVRGMERYEVTNCDELDLVTTQGAKGAGVYVSEGYVPAAITAWKPTGKAYADLLALTKKNDGKPRRGDVAFDRRMFSWKAPDGRRFAAVGGRSLLVLELEDDTWRVRHRAVPPKPSATWENGIAPEIPFALEVVGVVDMNGDGQVEIVVHERLEDAYGDFTLTPKGDGYRRVNAGIGGAFA